MWNWCAILYLFSDLNDSSAEKPTSDDGNMNSGFQVKQRRPFWFIFILVLVCHIFLSFQYLNGFWWQTISTLEAWSVSVVVSYLMTSELTSTDFAVMCRVRMISHYEPFNCPKWVIPPWMLNGCQCYYTSKGCVWTGVNCSLGPANVASLCLADTR